MQVDHTHPVNIVEALLAENAALRQNNQSLANTIDEMTRGILQVKAETQITEKLHQDLLSESKRIDVLKEKNENLTVVAIACGIVALGCIAYAFSPVLMPAIAAKWASIKIFVFTGLL